MLEEYGPVIKYIKGPDNDAADTLCRLSLSNSDVEERKITKERSAESYCVNKLYIDTFPLTYITIDKYRCKDKNLVEKLKHANYHTKYFLEAEIHLCLSVKIIKLSFRQFIKSI